MNRIIGIDLGTSTSEVSCIINGNPIIIPNLLGKKITPSVVHIDQDGEVIIGEEASEYLLTRPDCTFMEVKRKTGSQEKLSAHNKEYAPEELQSMLIKYLVNCAENFLDEKINRAVITVPAYFNDIQRRATAKAGELAGLNVERIINEPTAAALDYGLQNLSECKNILIYDFGGGTLDITVLELFEGVIDVKASSGNNHLGGKDIDEIIMQKLADSRGDERAHMRLKKAAEECKISLSENDSHNVSLPFLLTNKSGRPISVDKTVTREEFEGWIEDLVASTREPIMSALSDAKLKPEDLDIVLLVGGTTRIPYVKRMLAETLGQEPKALVDPDLTVARGAAIQGGIIEGTFDTDRELVLTDVCPFTLGIESMCTGVFEDKLIFSPIIPRNTTIPTERSSIYYPYYDYQQAVQINVYQGESQTLSNNEFLGELMLTDLPLVKSEKSRIEVTFAYDINGILQVTAKSLLNNSDISAVINTAGIKPKPVLDLSKWDQAEGAKRVRPAIRKAEKYINSRVQGSDDLEILLVQIKEALLTDDHEKVEELREELIDLMKTIDSWK